MNLYIYSQPGKAKPRVQRVQVHTLVSAFYVHNFLGAMRVQRGHRRFNENRLLT